MLQPMDEPPPSLASAGDDRKSGFGEQPSYFFRCLVLRVVRVRAGRSENRNALSNVREIVEAFDELPGDAHDAPGVGACEIPAQIAAGLKQLFVFGDGRTEISDIAVDDSLGAGRAHRRFLGWRRSARCAMTCFGPLTQPFAGGDLGLCRHLRARFFSAGGARGGLFRFRFFTFWHS
jgi:hypothetical protein